MFSVDYRGVLVMPCKGAFKLFRNGTGLVIYHDAAGVIHTTIAVPVAAVAFDDARDGITLRGEGPWEIIDGHFAPPAGKFRSKELNRMWDAGELEDKQYRENGCGECDSFFGGSFGLLQEIRKESTHNQALLRCKVGCPNAPTTCCRLVARELESKPGGGLVEQGSVTGRLSSNNAALNKPSKGLQPGQIEFLPDAHYPRDYAYFAQYNAALEKEIRDKKLQYEIQKKLVSMNPQWVHDEMILSAPKDQVDSILMAAAAAAYQPPLPKDYAGEVSKEELRTRLSAAFGKSDSFEKQYMGEFVGYDEVVDAKTELQKEYLKEHTVTKNRPTRPGENPWNSVFSKFLEMEKKK